MWVTPMRNLGIKVHTNFWELSIFQYLFYAFRSASY
jgi:hypothetical protein